MGFFLDKIVVFLFGTAVRLINEHRSYAWAAAGRCESLPLSAGAVPATSAGLMTVTWRPDEPSCVGQYRPRHKSRVIREGGRPCSLSLPVSAVFVPCAGQIARGAGAKKTDRPNGRALRA